MELCTDVQITPLLPLALVQSRNMAVTVSPAVLVTDLGEGGRAMTLPIEVADGVQWVTITAKSPYSYSLLMVRALICGTSKSSALR